MTRNQVYYLWQKENAKIWKWDADPLKSAKILLSENDRYGGLYDEFASGNVRALSFFAPEAVRLARSVTQLVMDSTYGTNNAGMDLFAVLAEIDGTGLPLAYCLLDVVKSPNESGKLRADLGAKTDVLKQFLQRLKGLEFNPRCFAIDKDQAEISAVRSVWPEAKIQLCYWHVKPAVNKKMCESKKTKTQDHYWPENALRLIPDLEVCWGTLPERRPLGTDHWLGRCECPPRTEKLEREGRLEVTTKKERDTVLEILRRHFHLHPLIPDENGTFKSADTIRRECVTELYTWCKARGYYRLWAYMFTNWYADDEWELWARSADPNEIPTVKTTMIVESHWRTLKHDYLHRFNRPRVDLVVWILTTRVIPDAVHRVSAIVKNNSRVYKARWRAEFKKHWRTIAKKDVDPEKLERYHTNPVFWLCGCKAFLFDRFLICKHLVHCFETPSADFFDHVKRYTTPPFWRDERLILRPELAGLADSSSPGFDLDELQDQDDLNYWEKVFDFEQTIVQDEDIDELPLEARLDTFKKSVRIMMDQLERQEAIGNEEFLRRLVDRFDAIRIFAEEVEELMNKRTMPNTWFGKRRHELTMYLK